MGDLKNTVVDEESVFFLRMCVGYTPILRGVRM